MLVFTEKGQLNDISMCVVFVRLARTKKCRRAILDDTLCEGRSRIKTSEEKTQNTFRFQFIIECGAFQAPPTYD